MDIRERLRQIESTRLKKGLQTPAEAAVVSPSDFSEAPIGTLLESPRGSVVVRERTFPLDHRYGSIRLGAFLDASSKHLSYLGKSWELKQIRLQNLVFLDTETTSLSGGAGTCAFLIGLGYFAEGCFCLKQLFMRDFRDEVAQLDSLNALLASHDGIVSYNGKSFDVPLLQSRNIFHRTRTPLEKMAHLDLLHAVRRHWKRKLPDCSLESAEKFVLQQRRNGDVPGFLIPQMYFHYLRTKDYRPILPVLYHNECDVLALVAFATKLLGLFENPIAAAADAWELLGVGKVYEEMGLFEPAILLYNEVLEKMELHGLRQTVQLRAALAHKKLRRWTQAAQLWQEAVAAQTFHPLPFIELAKHAEHRERNFTKAERLVAKALREMEIVAALRPISGWSFYQEDLVHRHKRLRKKLGQQVALTQLS